MTAFLNQDLFSDLEIEIRIKGKPSRLDPLSELMEHDVDIQYKARFANSKVPFMEFTKGDRRWLDHLINDLRHVGTVYKEDEALMLDWSTAKARFGAKQTWQSFIDDLYRDKTKTGQNYSESQLRHVQNLIKALSKGKRLAGCNDLNLLNVDNGTYL